MKKWRYIPPLNAGGKIQMVIDSWLFNEHLKGRQPPILRFYTWSQPTISLGFHQKSYPFFWQDLIWENQSLDLVQRPTGGRAVLHQGDLTYMIVTSDIPGRKWAVYQYLCQFLIDGWRSLSIDLQYGNDPRNYNHSDNCFATATAADLITKDGNKLIGSAQKRKGKVLLQHGAMMVNTDPRLYYEVFGENRPQAMKIPLNHVIDALLDAAKTCFEIELVTEPLSPSEWKKIFSNLEPCDLIKRS